MDTTANHQQALRWATELLEMTMADVTPEQMHWPPPGIANPLGATYAHAVCGMDAIVHYLLQGKQPLFSTEWAGKTGISDPQWQAEQDWGRRLKVDLPAARQYAQAVYTAVQDYIASLAEEDLTKELDLTGQGLGVKTLNWCINALVIAHTNNMAGEISALKGIQGAQGYPF